VGDADGIPAPPGKPLRDFAFFPPLLSHEQTAIGGENRLFSTNNLTGEKVLKFAELMDR